MDLSQSIEPKSDQQNFDDYLSGPKVVTVVEVKNGTPDQPVEVHLAEFPGRPFKPSKSMRRVLVAVWGPEAAAYAGRSLQLYGDPTVKFGGQEVGGIRISHMSHIDAPKTVSLTVSRGKRAPVTIEPLVTAAEVAMMMREASSLDELKVAWGKAMYFGFSGDEDIVALKDARKTELAEVVPDAGPAA